jgi:glycosyltransferase involved in cell wall biosynthesis
LRVQMGEAGQRLVQEQYGWKVTGERLSQLYYEVVS